MKSVFLNATDDTAFAARLRAALGLARGFDSHLTCVHVTPFDAIVSGDPFGGFYSLPTVLEEVSETYEAHRAETEAVLTREGVTWEWLPYRGQPAHILVDRSRLADLIVLSFPSVSDHSGRGISLPSDVAVHARCPVLAIGAEDGGFDCFGKAVVAWNGSAEAGSAIRAALPMLKKAASVHIVTVTEEETEFPATEASRYLALHGVGSELHEWSPVERGVAGAILAAADDLDASYIVMGAYGHSRIREALIGGVTRIMLEESSIPLLLAH